MIAISTKQVVPNEYDSKNTKRKNLRHCMLKSQTTTHKKNKDRRSINTFSILRI